MSKEVIKPAPPEDINITGDFKLTPEFLRDIVAKHTFHNSAAAALRELIQNAHDACIVRCAIDGTDDGAVEITLDPMEKTITVKDNGVGMTAQDIQDYLTTVGRGKKGGSIAEKYGIPAERTERLTNVVGEFGFGFIASFIIADKIEILTRNVAGGSPSLKCVFSTKGIAFEIRRNQTELPVGTTLVLYLNSEHSSLAVRPAKTAIEGSILSYDTVEAIIKKYCLLLQYPISVTLHGENSGPPLNQVQCPWEDKTNVINRVTVFYDRRQGQGSLGKILFAVPFTLSKAKGEGANLEGVLLVDEHGASGAPDSDSNANHGNVEVFVKRMWVCENQVELLPHWAWRMSGIIVTPDLRPLPGRDGLETQHDSFDRVKNALHRLLTDKFLELAQRNPKLFALVQDECGVIFRGGLVVERQEADHESRPFAEAELLRYVRLRRYSKKYLTGSPCTLNEYLNVTPTDSLSTGEIGRKVYYVSRPVPMNRQREFMQLLTSQNVDVLVAEDVAEAALFAVINNTFKDVSFQSVEKDLLQRYAGILSGEQRERWSLLLKFFNRLAEGHRMKSADVGAMQPDYMPAMVLSVDEENKLEPGEEKKKTEEEETTEAADLRATLLPHLPAQLRKNYSQTVVINTRNQAMKDLLEYKETQNLEQVDDLLTDSLHECYHLAILASMDILPAEWLQHHVEHQCGLIRHYIESKRALAVEQEGKAALQKEVDVERDKLDREKAEAAAKLEEEKAEAAIKLKLLEEKSAKVIQCEEVLGDISLDELKCVPHKPENRFGVIVVCDLVSSTESLLRMDYDERGELLDKFVEAARASARQHGGFFDKFTGDGVMALFGTECPLPDEQIPKHEDMESAAQKAWDFQQSLAFAVEKLNGSPLFRQVQFKNPALRDLRLCIAIDTGAVSFGRFGGLGSAVGIPVITAFRLCGERPAYALAERTVLVTEGFTRFFHPTNFEPVDYLFEPKGLNSKPKIYRRKQGV